MPKINARACMISGPPGIGKSSTAKIVAKELGFSILELNASDNRSKKTIEALLKDTSTSSSITRYGD
jgi:replication factor C subunit 1